MVNGRASWSNPRVLATLLLVFVAGAFTGAVGMRVSLRDRLHFSSSGWGKANKAELLDRCKKDLDLTPDQAREMAAILDDYATYYQNLQEQLSDVRSSGKSRILALLNDEQKQKFERMFNEMQKP
jgi:hypothetical protein